MTQNNAKAAKKENNPRFVYLAVVGVILAGLAALLANGLLYQVMFLPVIFFGVYAVVGLCFEIWEDLTRKN